MVYTSKVISSPVEEKVEDILGNESANFPMPQFNTMLETAIFVGSVMEEAYTDLMKEIGLNELAVYESTGAEILYEAEDGTETEAGKSFKEKGKEFLQKIWKPIKEMFEKAIAWFQEKLSIARKNQTNKLAKVWAAKKDQIPDDKKFGKIRLLTSKDVTDKKIDAATKENFNKRSNGFANYAGLFINAGTQAMNKLASGEETDVVSAIKASSNGVAALSDIESAKDIKPAILKDLHIPEKGVPATKAWVDANLASVIDIVVGGVDMTSIKKMYKGLKTEVNKKAAEIRSAKADNFKAQAQAVVKVLSFVSAADAAIVDIMKTRYAEANVLLTSVAVACKLGKKKEDAKEEAPAKTEQIEDKATQESAIISTIESAFEW